MQNPEFTQAELAQLCEAVKKMAWAKEKKEVTVSIEKVQKIGEPYTGIIIRDIDTASKSQICPIIPANSFYDIFIREMNKGISQAAAMETTASQVLNAYTDAKKTLNEKTRSEILEKIKDWPSFRENVIIHAVGKKKGKKYLQDKPHTVMGDICAVYGIETNIAGGKRFVPLTNNVLEHLGVNVKEIHKAAARNTMERYPIQVQPIGNILAAMGMPPSATETSGSCEMYVVTNSVMMNGAACLFYPDFKNKLAEAMPEGGAILPSSIHEVLCVTCNNNMEIGGLEKMVASINNNVVDPNEQLSDKAFVFDGENLAPLFGRAPYELKFKEGNKKEKSR